MSEFKYIDKDKKEQIRDIRLDYPFYSFLLTLLPVRGFDPETESTIADRDILVLMSNVSWLYEVSAIMNMEGVKVVKDVRTKKVRDILTSKVESYRKRMDTTKAVKQ